jgi:hypothetical protein
MSANDYFNRKTQKVEIALNQNIDQINTSRELKVVEQQATNDNRLILQDNAVCSEKNIKNTDNNNDDVAIKNNNFLNLSIDKQTSNNEERLKQQNSITFPDYENLLFEEISCDNRTFTSHLNSQVNNDHPILNIVFRRSLFNPHFTKILILVLQLNLILAFNAVLFSDSLIDERLYNFTSVNFVYPLVYETYKIILSILISNIVSAIVSFVLIIPKSHRDELNEVLKTEDKDKIKEG